MKNTLTTCTNCHGTGEKVWQAGHNFTTHRCTVCNGAGTIESDIAVIRAPHPQHPDSPYNNDRHERDYDDID